MTYDVLIVGGGPAGLQAALSLGRSQRRVLICDAGARRNAAATHINNFVTRDGTPPNEFRRVALEQLAAYPSVEHREARVEQLRGSKGEFEAVAGGESVQARRVILCTGMVDEMLPIPGFSELWGHSIFQCPYCHGWEVKQRPWGCLASSPEAVHFAVLLRSWTKQVTLFAHGNLEVDEAAREQLASAGVEVVTSPVARLRHEGSRLQGVELEGGEVVPCEALFAHPPQRHVELVSSLKLELEGDFVRVDPMTRETSTPGIYAAGDLTTRAQGAILAASTGAHAAGMLNHGLIGELAKQGLV